jgi:acyl-CoA thioester hydrolase
MEHQCSLTTRSYECDGYGHINNAVYLNYLEYARMEFLRALKVDQGELRAAGVGLVVVRIRIDYRRQVGPHETLRIVTRPLSKERVRVVFGQKVFRGEELVADAEVTWACVSSEGRPLRLPAQLDVAELEP